MNISDELADKLIIDLMVKNNKLQAQLDEARKAFSEVSYHLSEDQGFILDAKKSECVTCGKTAKTSSEIQHDIACFTKVWQDLLAALNPKDWM